MTALFRYLRGYYQVEFSSSHPQKILNFLLEKNIPVWGIESEEGRVVFCISVFHYRFLSPFLKTLSGGEEVNRKSGGILVFFRLFGKRWGFFSGLAFFFLSLYISTLFIWGVEVTGNSQIPARVIQEELKEFGVSPGVKISSFDPKDTGMRYLISDFDFVYVNINIIGTKACVEVREREEIPRTEQETGYANQVAEIFGVVERYEVLGGQIQVKRGDAVTEGQLLISGVVDNSQGGYYTVKAKGRVFARTERTFEVVIPEQTREVVYTGVEKEKISLEILGFTIPISLFSEEEYEGFVRQESVENLTVFGRQLPIEVRRVSFLETRVKKEPIILDRQRDLAYDKYIEFKRETFASDDEIIEENMAFSQEENGLVFTCTVIAVEDICKEVPFQVH